jgi:mRNA interferase RelE/StbE
LRITIDRKFLKDLARIPVKDRTRIEAFAFQELEQYKHLHEIGNLEKLHGHDTFYRARFGNYRVGVRYENDELTLERVLHRKEIYKFFP